MHRILVDKGRYPGIVIFIEVLLSSTTYDHAQSFIILLHLCEYLTSNYYEHPTYSPDTFPLRPLLISSSFPIHDRFRIFVLPIPLPLRSRCSLLHPFPVLLFKCPTSFRNNFSLPVTSKPFVSYKFSERLLILDLSQLPSKLSTRALLDMFITYHEHCQSRDEWRFVNVDRSGYLSNQGVLHEIMWGMRLFTSSKNRKGRGTRRIISSATSLLHLSASSPLPLSTSLPFFITLFTSLISSLPSPYKPKSPYI